MQHSPSEASQHHKLPLRTPEYRVCLLFVKSLWKETRQIQKKISIQCHQWQASNPTDFSQNITNSCNLVYCFHYHAKCLVSALFTCFSLTYEFYFPVVFNMVKGHWNSWSFSMQHSKLASIWFPSKGYDAFCNKRSQNSVKGQYKPLISNSYQRKPRYWRERTHQLTDLLLKHRLIRQLQGVRGRVSNYSSKSSITYKIHSYYQPYHFP